MALAEEFEASSPKKRGKVQLYDIHGVRVHVLPSEKPYMEKLFDSLAKIPAGREAIADMRKYKTDIYRESINGAGGFFDPEGKRIVLGKGGKMGFVEQALVHEARHLRQYETGGYELFSNIPDLASRIMIDRAQEADAYVQQLKACKQWEAIGHKTPINIFKYQYTEMVDAYDQRNSLSDAFKAWYDNDRLLSFYDTHYYTRCYMNVMHKKSSSDEDDDCELDSFKPVDIAKSCGGDRVEDFDNFMNSKKARQISLLTKTICELYNEKLVACGFSPDSSVAGIPVRDLKDNPEAIQAAKDEVSDIRKEFNPRSVDKSEKLKKDVRKIAMTAIDAVEKINKAAIEGKTDAESENMLKTVKAQMNKAFAPATPKKRSLQSLLTETDAKKSTRVATRKNDNSR